MTVEPAVHRALAVEANNSTWEILAKSSGEITEAEAEEMTRRAYAAAYHWERAEGAVAANAARADWLLSTVWVARGVGSLALRHAQRCMAVCESDGLGDFDLAYAHEAMARAHACLGDLETARRHRADAAAVPVEDPEDKAVVDADLAKGPWFGLAEG